MGHDAVRRWTDELARNPNSLAFLALAEELHRRRDLLEARAVAVRGLERHPYLADAHDLLARISVDSGDDQRARDEWEMATRLDSRHTAALKGLGFLAYRRGDLGGAERFLRQARDLRPDDEGLVTAHQRIVDALRPATNGHRATPNDVPDVRPSAAVAARALFAPLLGDGDRTALLLDRDGLVLAGTYVDDRGRDAGDEIGAELSGVSDEATRALAYLGLGGWTSLLVESQHATIGLAPAVDGAIVLVAAARDTHVGFVRRLVMQARSRAAEWLEAAP